MRMTIAALVACLLVGCSKPSPIDNKGRPVLKTGQFTEYGYFKYFMLDGHEYVRMIDGRQGGICHSPKCKCFEERR